MESHRSWQRSLGKNIFIFKKKVFLLFLCVCFRVFKRHTMVLTMLVWERSHMLTWLIVLKRYQKHYLKTYHQKIQGSIRKHILKKIIFSKTKNCFFFFIFNYFILIIVILCVCICFSLKRQN